MKISDITLTYVQQEYLKADGDEERIQQHMDSAKSIIMKVNGYETEEELDDNEYLTDVYLMYVQQLYDTGMIEENKSFNNLLTMDRRF